MYDILFIEVFDNLHFTGKEIIPVFFYIIGFLLIYLYQDKRKELLRFDQLNLDVYQITRNNIKSNHVHPIIEDLIKKFYLISLDDFEFCTTVEESSKKEVKGMVFSETIEMIKEYIKNNDNFNAIFLKTKFQNEIEHLNEGLDEILELDTAWKKIKEYGKLTNYCFFILLPICFLSFPMLLINNIIVWGLWFMCFAITIIFCVIFHKKFYNNKELFDEKKEKYYVRGS